MLQRARMVFTVFMFFCQALACAYAMPSLPMAVPSRSCEMHAVVPTEAALAASEAPCTDSTQPTASSSLTLLSLSGIGPCILISLAFT